LVVDGNAVERVDAAFTIATTRRFARRNLRDDFERFRVYLEQRRLLDRRTTNSCGDEQNVVLGAVGGLVEAWDELGVLRVEQVRARDGDVRRDLQLDDGGVVGRLRGENQRVCADCGIGREREARLELAFVVSLDAVCERGEAARQGDLLARLELV